MTGSVILFKNLNCNNKEYEIFTDNELIKKIETGDDAAEKYLYSRYIYVIRKIVSSFFILGGDADDLFQEAMIGLMKAVKSYNCDINDNFKYFAELCIRRQVISAVRKSRGYEKNLLNNSISLHELYDIEHGGCILDKLVTSNNVNPEIVVINNEEIINYYKITSKILSNFEKMVLAEYNKGKTYEEISFKLNKNVKSIDNALQRIKKKINNNKDKMHNTII